MQHRYSSGMRRRAEPAILTEASEYEGQQAIRVSCTQLDYTPVLDLPRLRSVRIMATPSMKPSHEDLRRQLPWSG